MNTQRLTTILASAYVSAMLASSVAPIRSDATLAATIDPTAAQQAFQNAVNGLNVNGWLAASTTPSAPKVATATASATRLTVDPVMTEELMARLIKFLNTLDYFGSVDAQICKVLDLCDGTKNLPLRLGKGDLTDGIHYIGIPVNPDSKDVLIMVKHGTVVEAYLTDKTGKLRAACVQENGTTHLITNEKAADKFKAEMTQFAKEAGSLPPTGTAVAGNS